MVQGTTNGRSMNGRIIDNVIIVLVSVTLLLISFAAGVYYTPNISNDDNNVNNINTLSDDNTNEMFVPMNRNTNVECPSMTCKFEGYFDVANSTGTSMLPTIIPGSKLITDINIEVSDIRVGEIIVYKNYDNVYIAHRLIFINETHFIALGDNNEYQDRAFPIDRIEGVIIGIFY